MTGTDLRFTDPSPRIHPTATLKSCRIGRYCEIGERTILREVELGDFSYFERHAEAMRRHRGKVEAEIAKLERDQDELLDRFVAESKPR